MFEIFHIIKFKVFIRRKKNITYRKYITKITRKRLMYYQILIKIVIFLRNDASFYAMILLNLRNNILWFCR